MKMFKLFVLAAVAAAALSSFAVATASATTLNLARGYPISSEAEGTTVLHSVSKVECSESQVAGTTANEGGATETVNITIETLTFSGCNATVTVLKKGTLAIHTSGGSANNNGTLTSTGAEVTAYISALGIDCIYSTNNTDLGTVTGSETTGSSATLDINASIPRTGGSFFCGSAAEWTGAYKVTAPNPLNVDGNSGEIVGLDDAGLQIVNFYTRTVGKKYTMKWFNNTPNKITINNDESTKPTIVKTEGKQCGEIAAGKTCETREYTCAEKGESVLINYENVKIRGIAVVECD